MITQLFAAAAILAAPTAPVPRCITVAEAGDVGMVATAEMVSGLALACAPSLPTTSFLRSEAGTAYLRRLQAGAAERRTRAIVALNRVLAGRVPSNITAEMILTSSTRQFPPPTAEAMPFMGAVCSSMDRLFEAVSPLPNENIGSAMSAMVDMMVAVAPIVRAGEARQRAAGRPVQDPMPDLSEYFCAR